MNIKDELRDAGTRISMSRTIKPKFHYADFFVTSVTNP